MEFIQKLTSFNVDFKDALLYLALYYSVINVYSYALVGYDKYKAKKRKYRIREMKFFLVSFIGGALGIVMGMTTFRHKTQHKSFYIGIPSIFLFNLLCIFLIFKLI